MTRIDAIDWEAMDPWMAQHALLFRLRMIMREALRHAYIDELVDEKGWSKRVDDEIAWKYRLEQEAKENDAKATRVGST